jgi:hypothetical protein
VIASFATRADGGDFDILAAHRAQEFGGVGGGELCARAEVQRVEKDAIALDQLGLADQVGPVRETHEDGPPAVTRSGGSGRTF